MSKLLIVTTLLMTIAFPAFCQEVRSANSSDGYAEHHPSFALLIGNSDYDPQISSASVPEASAALPVTHTTKLNSLKNPCNDVQAVGAKLVKMNWNEKDVTILCNVDAKIMLSAVNDFVQRFQYAEQPVAILYFAGHGIQVNGRNYLFGVNTNIDIEHAAHLLTKNPKATLFLKESVDLNSSILNSIGSIDSGALLVIIDACRNNPLLDIMIKRHLIAKLSAPKLLVSPPGIVTEFSTTDGAIASDGIGSNSPFAEALLNHLRPDIRIDDILAEVGTELSTNTDMGQVPARAGFFAQPKGVFWCLAGCLPQKDATKHGYLHLPVDGRLPMLALAGKLDSFLIAAEDFPPTNNLQPAQREANAAVKAPHVVFQRIATDLPEGSKNASPLNIDIFYCAGEGERQREEIANDIAEQTATLAKSQPTLSDSAIFQIRVRAVGTDADLPEQASRQDVITFDAEDSGSASWARSIPQPVPLTVVPSRQRLPGYMSIYVCSGSSISSPEKRIYFLMSNPVQEPLARRLATEFQIASNRQIVLALPEFKYYNIPEISTIHYFFATDAGDARALASTVSQNLNKPVIIQLDSRPDAPASPGKFEVWLGRDTFEYSKNPQEQYWQTNRAVKDSASVFRHLNGLPGFH